MDGKYDEGWIMRVMDDLEDKVGGEWNEAVMESTEKDMRNRWRQWELMKLT